MSTLLAGERTIRDLPAPITAAKCDWIRAQDFIGFTPTEDSTAARLGCQNTVARQFGNGYVIEYISKKRETPNSGFESDPDYQRELAEHPAIAGRLIAVHKLLSSALPLQEIMGKTAYDRLQDLWSRNGKRWRWSVAFPIIESYRIVSAPHASQAFGDELYLHLFAHADRLLRPLPDEARQAIADLQIEPLSVRHSELVERLDAEKADGSEIPNEVIREIGKDLSHLTAWEGMPEERKVIVRKRCAYLAHQFKRSRRRAGRFICDRCQLDPSSILAHIPGAKLGSLLHAHHLIPPSRTIVLTTISDFALLCPTCHAVTHIEMDVARRITQ